MVSGGWQASRGHGAREVEGEAAKGRTAAEEEKKGKTAEEEEEKDDSEGRRRGRREKQAGVMTRRRMDEEVAVKGPGGADGLSWSSPVAQNPETPQNQL